MAPSDNAKQLKMLRERAGIGLREFARLIGLGHSRYQYYEDKYKKQYLTREFVELVAPHLMGRGDPPVTREELAGLAGAPVNEMPNVTEPIDDSAEPLHRGDMPKTVKVLGTSVGGSAGDFTMNGDTADWVRRPPRIAKRTDVFALYVQGDSMSHWREPGDLVYCESSRPPRSNDYVVVEMKPASEGAPKAAYLKKLLAITATTIRLLQYNPEKTIVIERKNVHQIYRVIDWSELLGV